MTRHVALLRAINVGGRTVTMERLREIFGSLGLDGVQTLIASGNVVFGCDDADTAALEARVEERLERELGFAVATFVRPCHEIRTLAAFHPFPELEPGDALSVVFTRSEPGEEAVRRVLALRTSTDDLRLRGREVFWRCRTRVSGSGVTGATLERALGMPATVRNVTTVRTLAARLCAG